MKSFDLEAARNGGEVCLNNGSLVKIICFDFDDGGFWGSHLLVLSQNTSEYDNLYHFKNSGEQIIASPHSPRFTLHMAPKKYSGWAAVKMGMSEYSLAEVSNVYENKDDALSCFNWKPDAVIQVSWEF